eukprot:7570460-Ditylum_brightwellii.AAC.1
MVLSAIMMGVEGKDIANLVTFLDIPHTKGIRRVYMPCIKDDIGEEPLTYKEWFLLPSGYAKKCVAIVVSFNMEWWHHGFCLLSGHAFMIGAQSSKIIDVV